ncbi:locomotion-related protein Hikaru genki isoform X1 [Acyrthosiphon pisum]|uniref:Locomotion-related protein Hikaru genki n=1 Tax=Acyrthosiphon pisum TaxID=7029 RepID=A0A8R1W8P6_ACYPI|nr:locomotion-related protein Hikaru genki isoform X1 [Acyrthosiphon pisum]|eukprot:XP_003245168.1 PREDICTED: locomotion-related protein Hikaru genki-like isoform X1 [Acyrthosiphon pisum]
MARQYAMLTAVITVVLGTYTTASALGKVDKPTVDGGGCPSPGLTLNGTRVVPRSGMSPDFSTLSEVKFPARLLSPSGKGSASVASSSSVDAEAPSRICKIKCVSGQWVGPLCQEVNGDGRFQPILKSCALEEVPPNLILSFKNRIIIELNTTIPHNSTIAARCQEPIGTYKLSGPPVLNCSNGIWSSPIPKCQPTTLFTNYSENSPPTILVRVPSGSAAVDQNGGLVVFPGSILHLECLYLRRHGDPEWTWTSEAETYLTGWAIGNDERNWKYRLSIYYVKQFDTGSFTCTTSRGINNTITLQVSDIHCKPVPSMDLNPHLNYRASGHRLGQTTYFNCPPGFFLKGSANITCLPSGDWSNSPPDCIMVKCPPISVDDSRLIMVEYNDTYGKRAAFKCAWGFQMSGVNSIECLADSTWSHRIPTCTEILCPPPVVPLNGLLIEDSAPGRHVVGSVVQFSCGEKHQLIGKPSMVCTENGTWSHSTPYCKARCEYPGEPPNGRIIPLKFWYVPGDKLKITCLAGYVLPLPLEASPPVCLGDGTWSHTLPECIQYTNV